MIILGQHLHPWINERVPIAFSPQNQYIGWAEKGKVIACTAYTDYNGKCIQVHVAGDGKRWMRREHLWACMHYPFVQLKLNWLIGVNRESNWDARKMNSTFGYEEFSHIPDGYADGEDLILLRLHRTHPNVQRWLRLGERYGKGITAASA